MAHLNARVRSIVYELADCLCREIATRGGPEPCFCGILPGDDAPFVYCNACEGGQAWVRLVGVGSPQGDFDLALNRCSGVLVVEIEMGMIFGFLGVGDDGEPVGAGANLDAVDRQLEEMDLMHHVLTCCGLTIQEKPSGLSYTPVGPEGGCLGGIWSATVPVL